MILSYSHKFIFFHISKVAGLSIREALKDYVREPEKFKIARPPKNLGYKPNLFYEMWQSSLLHAKARDAKKELDEEVFNSFYKFAFVRNPWDWQVSYYHFILKETTHIRHKLVKSMGSFEEYLEWVIKTKNPFAKGTTKLQKDVITDADGKLIVDFVGRYETLAQDFDYICKVLSIDASLPHLNKTIHRDYRSYYNEKTKKLVGEYCQEDIDLFGYTFDGYYSESQQGDTLQKTISKKNIFVNN
ncbi:MAG: sulfotransferase family protein [Moorea sp. SIO4E2]|uniref:sulfotransferase family 2 domain-containing protein n=1 Tax=Moorena sp. SIO4E2 TaxID=2607826 RepID=UPI0013BD3D6B|nr:sulfotransferase family 2 domain-containing protein [Moorena sp. SIO4E2]NEQ09195.1 sulfotransferase family protein [Moorena sp. SIO4E2]